MHMLFIKKKKKEVEMNIFLYIIIFIMGTVFGSFYTLAVYRIPKRIDIIKTHSFCPNCGHKLSFLELIPILSYVFQCGKCKNCKQKIRPRYLILEIVSGLVFVLTAVILKIDVYNLNLEQIIKFSFIVLYFTAIIIIAGIDKEKGEIEKSVLYYSILVSCSYIIYLCIMGKTSIYRYVMYLITLIILLILDNEILIRKAEASYIINILILIVTEIICLGEFVCIGSIIFMMISICALKILYYIKNNLNKHKKVYNNISQIYRFGYLFCIASIFLYIMQGIII